MIVCHSGLLQTLLGVIVVIDRSAGSRGIAFLNTTPRNSGKLPTIARCYGLIGDSSRQLPSFLAMVVNDVVLRIEIALC